MAEKRMFSKKIIDSDAFLDMALSTQALYFHLSMRADDEGFINNPKKILRMIGASPDELKILNAKRFVLDFDNGIIVIKHWKIHNTIRRDRIKETVHKDEANLLSTKENGAYTFDKLLECSDDNDLVEVSDECQPNDNQVTAQIRLDKISLEEISLDKKDADKSKKPRMNATEKFIRTKVEDENLIIALCDFAENRKKLKSAMTDRAITLLISKLNEIDINVDVQIQLLETAILNGWKSVYPPKNNNQQQNESQIDVLRRIVQGE